MDVTTHRSLIAVATFDGEELIAMSDQSGACATANSHMIQSGAVSGSVKSESAMLCEVSLRQEVESRRQQYRNGRSEHRRSLSSAGIERF